MQRWCIEFSRNIHIPFLYAPGKCLHAPAITVAGALPQGRCSPMRACVQMLIWLAGLSSARLVNIVRAAAARTLGVLQKICETPPCSIDKYPPK